MKVFYGIAVMAMMALGFFLGSTVGMFGENLCYMSSINSISEIYSEAIEREESEYRNAVRIFIKEIPNRGYESSCTELEKHVEQFNKNWS